MNIVFQKEKGEIKELFVGGKQRIHVQQPLFQIVFMDGEGNRYEVSSRMAGSVQSTREGMNFSDFSQFPGLQVETAVREEPKSLSFGISIRNNTELYIETLQYPCLNLADDLTGSGGEGKVFFPYCEGVVCGKVKQDGDDKTYPGFMNMQFEAYYDDKAGLYYACEDPAGTPKVIDCKPAEGGLDFMIQTYLAVAPGADYHNAAYSVLREFEGDWQDACQLYRNFTESSDFALPEKIRDWKKAPQWFDESPVVVIYPVTSIVGIDYFGPNEYFPYLNGKKYLDNLSQDFDHNVMALLINWEGSAPWCPPFIWPPYGGEESLKAFVDAMHRAGNYVGLYASGINWTDQSVFRPEYDMTEYRKKNGIDAILCTKPDGSLDEERCVRSVRSGYHMCPACEQTKQMTYEQIEGIAECDIDYLQYFDQNIGGAPDRCYSSHHGHPPVYGEWAVREMKKLYRGIEEIFEKKGKYCVIGAESSPSDCFIKELKTNDLRFPWPMANCNFTGIGEGTVVPAFQYVFHEYSMNFMGNQCVFGNTFSGQENPKSLNLRLAYSFAAGDMLTVVLKSGGEIHFGWGPTWLEPGPDQNETKAFVKALCAMRRGLGKPYLVYGRMEKMQPVQCDTVTLIGKEGNFSYPAVFSSRWSAADGSKAVILVNHTDRPQKITVSGSYRNRFSGNEVFSAPESSTLVLQPFEILGLTEQE
ncbi:MAG: DUF6259 domain-containing protein [Clostridia bacterium]|nr:DUF6259 domain-containing protein [Clostridia bacterium]